MARHSGFNDALGARIIDLYKKYKTDAKVAKKLGVSVRTLQYWKSKHPSFLHWVRETKTVADDMVESAFWSRAVGYTVPDEKIFCTKDGDIIRAKTFKHYPPDVNAGMFWLTNRNPEKWRNRFQVIAPEPTPQPNSQVQPKKKTYVEFCETADYNAPYPKQEEMRVFAFNETDPRLLLGTRGCGKTDYITVMGDAYQIYLDWYAVKYEGKAALDDTTLIMTKSKERNASMLAEIANALEKNGVPLSKRNATSVRVEGLIGKDHSVSAVTIKTVSLRGRHPKRAILDDPVTEDDTSEATRKLVQKKYNEVMKLTQNVLVIGQPAHKFDLYAKLRGIVKKMEVPHGSIPELDHDIQAQRAAGVDEASIQASYFLKILPEGATPFDNIKYIDTFPTGESSALAFIDPAKEGKDLTSVAILKKYFDGFAIVGFCWRRSWNHSIDDFIELFKKYNVTQCGFETNGVGENPIDILRATFKEAGLKCGVNARYSTTEKHSTIMAAGAYAHLLHLAKESHPKFTEAVIQYEYGAVPDDPPDSIARALEWIGLIRGKEPKRA